MAEAAVDDWQPVAKQVDDWQPVRQTEPPGPFSPANEMVQPVDPMTGSPIPEAFKDRINRGEAVQRILDQAAKDMKTGFGDQPIANSTFSPDEIQRARDLGILHDPVRGGVATPLSAQFFAGAATDTMTALGTVMRGVNAGIQGAGGALGQLVDELGGQGEGVRKEAINLSNYLMMEAGFGHLARPHVGPDGIPHDQPIGGLPKSEDFKAGADVLGSPAAEPNLRQLWEERGIHPAEAVHDAQSDAFLRADIAPPAMVGFHGTSKSFDEFDLQASRNINEKGAAFFFDNANSAGMYATGEDAAVYQATISPGKSRVFDVRDVLRSDNAEQFVSEMRKAHQRYVTRNEDMAAAAETPEGVTRSERAWEHQLETIMSSVRNNENSVPFSSLITGAVVEMAKREGLDTAVIRGMREGGGPKTRPPGDQIVVLNQDAIEITHKNGVPLTPTKLSEATNTPIVSGTPRSELAKTGEPHIDEILDNPVTKRVIDNPVADRDHTVPYTAGGSVPMADPTIFIDRRFPHSFTIDGVTFDPADPFVVHENVEQHVMENLIKGGMDAQVAYKVAHFEFAEKVEGAWYRAHGIDQEKAEAAYAPFMARIQHEQTPATPANLYDRPYPHDNPSAALHEPIDEPKPTRAEIAEAKRILAEPADQADLRPAGAAETIASPAVNIEGKIYTGRHHQEAFEKAAKAHGQGFDEFTDKYWKPGKGDGFVTSKGRYVERDEAYRIADAAEQLHEPNLDKVLRKNLTQNEVDRASNLSDEEADKAGLTEPNKNKEWLEAGNFKGSRAGDVLGPAGADVTRPENLPTLAEQPAPPPGRLAANAKAAVDQLMGLGRNIQFALDPMATGSRNAMVIAKDAMNSVRRIRWEHMRLDAEIVNSADLKAARGRLGETQAEQLARMWNAADEESVLRQEGYGGGTPSVAPDLIRLYRGEGGGGAGLPGQAAHAGSNMTGGWFTTDLAKAKLYGDVKYVDVSRDDLHHFVGGHGGPDEFVTDNPVFRQRSRPFIEGRPASEHMGLAILEPEERAMVERAHAQAQSAWLHAVDAGIVEGEGLPAYTPRMVLNVANAGDNLGPRALNELGRNVFTRTSQMLHRGYLTAEETETAAKALVGQRMAERGASMAEIEAAQAKVEIARNIRALPLAAARLEEAAVWREMINKVEDAGKAAGRTLVSEIPGAGRFTIAGNPAFTKWGPAFENGTVRMGEDGRPLMVPKPLYMDNDFRGPMTSILDPGQRNLVPGAASAYGALMAIKGKAMTAILNSPLIHNEVVWSKVAEAAGGREWLGFGLYYKGNRITEGNPGRFGQLVDAGVRWFGGETFRTPARASELIERGLNPIGPRGAIQDITGIMEEPFQPPGRSWTAQVAAAVPGLFSDAAGAAVKRAIDRAGDFTHNTLLWDRVRDLQFGLADHLSDRLVAKGADRLTADRVAAHFSNIIVGSIPKEAMSAAARATANLFMFSRSFTLGNLSTFKQAAVGLPKPILAQIERDFGVTGMPEAQVSPDVLADVSKTATSIARRKAISTIMLSAGLYYIGNAIIQHAFNIAKRDQSLNDQFQGYARRFSDLMSDVSQDPFELRHLLGRLSPTYDNEPRKQDRAFVGNTADGTGIYARNPTGKFGEEMVGYPTQPLTMLQRKLSPLAGGLLDILENDKFGGAFDKKAPIYDPNDMTIGAGPAAAFAIAKHLVMRHLPEGQIQAGVDLLHGDGDPGLNKLRLVAPMFGFTVSQGAPGGPARGEQLSEKADYEAKFSLAWPDIRKQIRRGDVDGGREALKALGTQPRDINSLVRSAINPAGALRGRTLQNFLNRATPVQRERFDNAR